MNVVERSLLIFMTRKVQEWENFSNCGICLAEGSMQALSSHIFPNNEVTFEQKDNSENVEE